MFYVFEDRSGETWGSYVMSWLVRGYNETAPKEQRVTRPHCYVVLKRNVERGWRRRYKGLHITRHDHCVPCDHVFD